MRSFPIIENRYDVIVVGGGLAGVCAAIAAARHGAVTALVQERTVLGGNSSSEVRVNPRGAGMMNAWARETGIIEEMVLEERRRNHAPLILGLINSVWDQVLYEWVLREPLLTLYLDAAVDEVHTRRGRITAVLATQRGTERRLKLVGRYIVDATGDGTVGALAGAEFHQGREARQEFGESLSPETGDTHTQGSTILFHVTDTGQSAPFTPPSWAVPYTTLDPDYARAMSTFWRHGGGLLWIEIGAPYDTITDNAEIRQILLSHVYGVWNYIKNSGAYPADNLAIDWIGSVVGKRESRRLLGDHMLTQPEVWQNEIFSDRVAYGGWWLDIHKIGGILADGTIQKKRSGVDEEVTMRPFGIPYRSLYSRNIGNLFMAGRDISVTHAALGSVRIMCTCAVMGQAVGTAAAIAARHRITPRQVGQRHLAELQQTLCKDDAFIPNRPNVDLNDLARSARVTADSTARLQLLSSDAVHVLEVENAQIIPLANRLNSLALYLRSQREDDITLTLSLAPARDIWDFRPPDEEAFRTSAVVQAGSAGWVEFPCTLDIPQPGLYQVSLLPAPGITVATTTPAPGVSAAWKYPRWQQRWQGMKDTVFAMRLDPEQSPFAAENVVNGTARPEAWPNLWISDPVAELPQTLALRWDAPVTFDAVYLTFDTYLNEDPPELPPLWCAPQCVRDYRLEIRHHNRWQPLAAMTGNYQRRVIHRCAPVTTDALRMVVTATNGDPSARVYEVRVYREEK